MASACIVLAGFVTGAGAVEVDELAVSREGRAYHIRMSFEVIAPLGEVIEVLTDFEHPKRLNPEVESRKVVDRFDDVTRVRTELRSCLFLFCRNIGFTQDVTIDGPVIRADIVPEVSDFRSGTMRWSISAAGEQSTRVVYEATMEPAVFIPPLFGKALVRKMIEQEMLTTAANLEIEATMTSDEVD